MTEIQDSIRQILYRDWNPIGCDGENLASPIKSFYDNHMSYLICQKYLRGKIAGMMLTLVLLLTAFLFISPSLADREASPKDYVQTVPGGKYVFVMLVPTEFQGTALPSVEIDKEVRKRYSYSGLYWKEDPRIPLWTVDWYSFIVYPSTDGIHLARLKTSPEKDEYDIPGLMFYRNGQKLQEFTVRQLIKDLDILPLTVSHYMWLKHAQWDDFGLFAIETLTGEKRVFNPSRMKGPGREPPQVTCMPNTFYK